MTEKSDLIFVEHILDSLNAINEFSREVTKENLSKDRLKQSAIIRELEIIGEATKNISNILKTANPEVKWKEITGTRDILIHHYFGVDINIIWTIINKDLPELKEQMQKIKSRLQEEE